ncbi:glycoside hydrolase family 10 protein [Mariniflexile sp.]|uniref:glycoside hydrolase family 10 protein n=1 Tax=Mariniflexile sp. TaxID=1979402 RepID=UPI004048D312
MKVINKYLEFFIILIVLILGCNPSKKIADNNNESIITSQKQKNNIQWNPKTPYNIEEFRAAWVATVANINWPSKPGLSSADQQKEALILLDCLKNNNFNAVIFQVRPQADALYYSQLEPWSYYLTGKQGQAPEPFYDPLQFWVEAAHERGLELHVWLNPYRAHHTQGGEISDKSLVKTNPELVVKLENGMYWMDPSLQGTQDQSLSVVLDIVKRYDIDGVHFDDYFYPYEVYNNGKDFPDDKSWNAYFDSGGSLSKADWRRQSVNTFVKKVYTEIKAVKPYVKFGISPFGIWKPGFPESIKGFNQYERLYADAKLWLNEGWIDYFAPQLYWKINKIDQSFPVLLGWWQSENTKKRHLWPGISTYATLKDLNANETLNQIMITRGLLPSSKGTIHWSIEPLIRNDTLSKALLNGPYSKSALVPPSSWLDNLPPSKPLLLIKRKEKKLHLTWNHNNEFDVFRWVLYYQFKDENWDHIILDKNTKSYIFQNIEDKNKQPIIKVGLTAVDRTGNQSEFFEIEVQ